jgi:deoxycytidylate deaminase
MLITMPALLLLALGLDQIAHFRSPILGRAPVFEKFVPGGQPSHGKLLDMCRFLHAEETALLSPTRNAAGITTDRTLYTTTFPCNLCANKIVATGIKNVVFAEPYPMKDAMETLRKAGIVIRKSQGVKSSAFFRLYR